MRNVLMKLWALVFAIFSFSQTIAQKVKISEPEWDGDIVYVNDSVGKGLSLERQQASVKGKANASMYVMGMGKVTATYNLKGSSSPVRIRKKSTLQFIYKSSSNEVNPKSVIQVFKLQQAKNQRKLEIGSVETFKGSSAGDISFIEFKAEKYGKSSYLITLTNLQPGEYAFSLGSQNTSVMFAFGVDGDGSEGSGSIQNQQNKSSIQNGKGNNIFDFGYSYAIEYGSGLQLKYEHKFNNFSVGVFYSKTKHEGLWMYEKIRIIAGRACFHTNISESFDLHYGVMAGGSNGVSGGFFYAGLIGVRYFFVKNVGVHAEIAYGSDFIVNGGISFRF
ncbi:MAG: hypothetical protein WC223_11075 [Bacteroidales bacterium]|jgi:hypothetical protein